MTIRWPSASIETRSKPLLVMRSKSLVWVMASSLSENQSTRPAQRRADLAIVEALAGALGEDPRILAYGPVCQ
jgi:hypothetical protein